MKKKEFGNHTRVAQASGHSFGSRLIGALLVSGCFLAAATLSLSLFFYFFPAQAIRSFRTVQSFAHQLLAIGRPEEEPPLQSNSTPLNLQQSSGWLQTANASSATDKVISVAGMAKTFSQDPEPEQTDMELFSNEDYLFMLDSAMGPMLYYNQGDSRWGNYLYGGMDAMSQYGCGPTVVAMLIHAFTGHAVTPPDMADWALANGFHSPHNGSRHGIIMGALSAYGLQVESAPGTDYDTAAGLLRSGHVLIALMGKGTFSSDGKRQCPYCRLL